MVQEPSGPSNARVPYSCNRSATSSGPTFFDPARVSGMFAIAPPIGLLKMYVRTSWYMAARR
jgi:hypothetical protein